MVYKQATLHIFKPQQAVNERQEMKWCFSSIALAFLVALRSVVALPIGAFRHTGLPGCCAGSQADHPHALIEYVSSC